MPKVEWNQVLFTVQFLNKSDSPIIHFLVVKEFFNRLNAINYLLIQLYNKLVDRCILLRVYNAIPDKFHTFNYNHTFFFETHT